MADYYWGQSPEVLTISNFPVPTTTTFTVSSAINLLVGQYILVSVGGNYERTQITSKIGNALTVLPPLSSAPTSPGSVLNSRELTTRTKLNSGAVFNASSIADLKTVDTTYAVSGLKYHIPSFGSYLFNKGSSATSDDNAVVAPIEGGGRWVRQVTPVSAISDTFAQSSHGFTIGTPVRHNGSIWVSAQNTSISNATDVWIVVAVPSNDAFIALQKGRYTISSTTAGSSSLSLSAGTLYYLSTTAGAVTATKPVGTHTQPLGFHLPLFFVENTGGGSSVIHVLGQGYPTIDNIIAEFYTSTQWYGNLTFSNLDISAHKDNYVIRGDVYSTASSQWNLRLNGYSGNNYLNRQTVESSTTVTTSSTNQTGIHFATGVNYDSPFKFRIDLQRYYSGYFAEYLSSESTFSVVNRRTGTVDLPSYSTNLTSLLFMVGDYGIRPNSRIRICRGDT